VNHRGARLGFEDGGRQSEVFEHPLHAAALGMVGQLLDEPLVERARGPREVVVAFDVEHRDTALAAVRRAHDAIQHAVVVGGKRGEPELLEAGHVDLGLELEDSERRSDPLPAFPRAR
jgi:hypothetical protein